MGRFAERMTSAAAAMSAGSAWARLIRHVRGANSSAGQSKASACTSCGSASVTAPVSAGSVSTRIALSRADGSCSGRFTRSKYLRQRAERVVDGQVTRIRLLELLEHRTGHARREGAGRQQQHRDPVDGGQGRTGQHVGRAGADGGGAGPGLEAVLLARVADGGVHHRLLVAGQDVGEPVVAGRATARSAAAPARCRRRCHGRRCRNSRRTASAARRRARSTVRRETGPRPGRR